MSTLTVSDIKTRRTAIADSTPGRRRPVPASVQRPKGNNRCRNNRGRRHRMPGRIRHHAQVPNHPAVDHQLDEFARSGADHQGQDGPERRDDDPAIRRRQPL